MKSSFEQIDQLGHKNPDIRAFRATSQGGMPFFQHVMD